MPKSTPITRRSLSFKSAHTFINDSMVLSYHVGVSEWI